LAVYHILADSEPFSRHQGGASAHWVAGVVAAAGLEEQTVVVCPEADGSFDFPYVWVAPEMGKISLLPRPLQHPILWRRRARFYAHLLKGFVSRLIPADIVYVHNRPEMALATVWAQQRRPIQIPVILAMNDCQLCNAPRPMVRHVAGRMTRVVFPTEFLHHQAYEKYGLHMRASVLPWGADDAQFHPYPDSPPAAPAPPSAFALGTGRDPLIVYAGPLLPSCGVHVLIETARLLHERGTAVRVLIIDRPDPGASMDGVPSRSELEDYLRRLRVSAGDNVWFESYMGTDHVAAAMQSAAVVVCPSIQNEAFGLSNVEAMAAGVAVAASCVGGIPEVFSEGGALLVPPGDPVALANAVQRLLGRTGVGRLMRREGRESFLRNFSWPRIAQSYVKLIESISIGLPLSSGSRAMASSQSLSGSLPTPVVRGEAVDLVYR